MNAIPPGHCPRCLRAVDVPGLRATGVWHGADTDGEPVGGDLFEVRCPACGAELVAYLEADTEPLDPGQLSWQAPDARAS